MKAILLTFLLFGTAYAEPAHNLALLTTKPLHDAKPAIFLVYERDFGEGPYSWRVEVGNQGLFALAGFNVATKSGLYASAHAGAGLVPTGPRLSSVGQFTEELGLGLASKSHYIGAVYKHVSCANFCHNNLGRDYLGIELGFGL